jgi:hypothetical protein
MDVIDLTDDDGALSPDNTLLSRGAMEQPCEMDPMALDEQQAVRLQVGKTTA